MRGRGALLKCTSALVLSAISTHSLASPLPVRDQNPLLAGFELPASLPAEISATDRWTFDASFAWGNSATVQRNTNETVIVDAETRELRMAFGRTFGDGYALRLELPFRRTSPGTLDSFIDGWHDFFGLPEGARPNLPRDALHIAYERDGRWLVDTRTAESGVGDVSLQLGKQLTDAPLAAWLSVKLPTGDADQFTGSGGVDVSAAVAFERAFADRYSVFAQAAASWLGDGDRMPSQQKSFAWSGSAGLGARTWQSLTLIVQLDAHAEVFESDESFLGDAVMLTIGGTYRTGGWDLSFAVTEDIAVESSPDVAFLFQLKRAHN